MTSAAAALALFGAPAQAGLVGDTVTAALSSPNGTVFDPTPISLVDAPLLVDAAPPPEISAGNGTSIGGFMSSGTDAGGTNISEFIDFLDTTIELRILAGAVVQGSSVTGYAAGARYVFSGLDFAGGTIIGVSASGSAADIANIGDLSSWVTLDNAHQVSFALDAIQFVDKVNADFADITLTLRTTQTPPNPTPEPGSVALGALALLGLWRARRGQRTARRGAGAA